MLCDLCLLRWLGSVVAKVMYWLKFFEWQMTFGLTGMYNNLIIFVYNSICVSFVVLSFLGLHLPLFQRSLPLTKTPSLFSFLLQLSAFSDTLEPSVSLIQINHHFIFFLNIINIYNRTSFIIYE